jgi:large subunit ribosomal protein L25
MEKIVLELNTREETGKVGRLLDQAGQVRGVVYGRGQKSTPVKAERKQLEKVFLQAGTSKIVSLKLDGRLKNALFYEVQRDPRTGTIKHVDLYTVKMDEKIKTEIPLHFIGESTAVYQQEGTLVKNLETVEVEALPADLPESVEVDISTLDDFEKTIHVSDLKIPAGVELLTETEELVAKVEPPRSDEELAELDEAPTEELPAEVQEESKVVEEESGGDRDQQPKGT